MVEGKRNRLKHVSQDGSALGAEPEEEHVPWKPSHPGEGQFRLAFDHAPIGMALVGMNYRLQRVNRTLCAALGYSHRELLEHTFTDIAHPDDVNKDKAVTGQLFRGEIPSYRLEKRFITKDGRLAWLDVTALLIKDQQHVPLYVLAMVEDITERKRAEEALRTSEERYRSFVVNSSEGIWRYECEKPIDTGLSVDEQIEMFRKYAYLAECNDTMARMFGRHCADDLIGARFGDLRVASEATNLASVRSFINNGYRLHNVESVRPDADGRLRYFSSNVIGIVVNGYLLRTWGTQRDETKRRLAEEEIKNSRQQMRALAARLLSLREKERAELAREIHDVLGQGLAGLKMDISRFSKMLSETIDETVRAMIVERLKSATTLLNETIIAVKNISTELRPRVLDTLGLSAAVEWQCQEFERRTRISCECRLPAEDARVGAQQSTALFRILQEALTNVARHANARSVLVELNVDDSQAILRVQDDGKGMTEEQASAPTSLGLLGMRERALILDGTLTVNGRQGHGTTVTASIPLAEASAVAERNL